MSEWQPIETAPKDGTHVIVYRHGWKRARSGHFSAGTWWTNGEPLSGEPDVWMPLPPPPEVERE